MAQLQPLDIPRREESENRGAADPASDHLRPFWLVTECSTDMGCICFHNNWTISTLT